VLIIWANSWRFPALAALGILQEKPARHFRQKSLRTCFDNRLQFGAFLHSRQGTKRTCGAFAQNVPAEAPHSMDAKKSSFAASYIQICGRGRKPLSALKSISEDAQLRLRQLAREEALHEQ
jgi:hypothetical protein